MGRLFRLQYSTGGHPMNAAALLTRSLIRGSLLAACALLTGCYGAGTHVVAPTSTVPVSMSRAVRRADGSIVRLGEREVIGQVHIERTVWSEVYGAVNLDDNTDISNQINEQVAAVGGDAVVNLTISGQPCGWGYVFILNWLPFWPGCANLDIDGEIIRVLPRAAPVGVSVVASAEQAVDATGEYGTQGGEYPSTAQTNIEEQPYQDAIQYESGVHVEAGVQVESGVRVESGNSGGADTATAPTTIQTADRAPAVDD